VYSATVLYRIRPSDTTMGTNWILIFGMIDGYDNYDIQIWLKGGY